MIETFWDTLPFPYTLLATSVPIPPLEASGIIERLLEDVTGLAACLASAACSEKVELDQNDAFFAARLLAEYLHATLQVWTEWQAQQGGSTTPPEGDA